MNITFEHDTKEFSTSLNKISKQDIEKFIDGLVKVKNNKGRIFFLGVGGSAANCSHAVNDFRKLSIL